MDSVVERRAPAWPLLLPRSHSDREERRKIREDGPENYLGDINPFEEESPPYEIR
jgi:hypothetical protein